LINVFFAATGPLENDFAAHLALLPEGRRQKIARLKRPDDQKRSLAAGLLLRQFLGVTKDEDLAYNHHGQPRLASPGPYFSLSHCGEMAALAIGSSPLGLDLERKRPNLNWERLALAILTPAEREALKLWPNSEEFVLAAFTLKESLAKATGLGITRQGLMVEALAKGQLDQQPQDLTAKDPRPQERRPNEEPSSETKWRWGHRLVLGYHLAVCSAQVVNLKCFEVLDLPANPRPRLLTSKILWPLDF
jgi:phosphopantetheinyl transferase